MRHLFSIILLLTVNYCFSQSLTEKYNSYKNRYEYFNSDGNLVGYKKWNSYKNQYEYFKVEREQNSYGNYVEPVNRELLNNVMASKQNQYEYNYNLVLKRINYLSNKIRSYYSNEYSERRALKHFGAALDMLAEESINYSSAKNTNAVLTALDRWYYETIEKISD